MKEFTAVLNGGLIIVQNEGRDFMFLNEKKQLHRDGDKPALIRFDYAPSNYKLDSKGGIKEVHRLIEDPHMKCHVEYHVNGKLHRDGDKPAVINKLRFLDEKVILKWYRKGELHRDGDKPAIIEYTHNDESPLGLPFVYKYDEGVEGELIELITDLDELINFIPCKLEYWRKGDKFREIKPKDFLNNLSFNIVF